MTIKTNVKAGKIHWNHNARQLRVRSGVKAGKIHWNHNVCQLRVRSGVKAGGGLGAD